MKKGIVKTIVSSEQQIVRTQKYTFEINHYDDGKTKMTRHNDGFSILELFGITALIQTELYQHLHGQIKLEINEIERTLVKENE